MDEGKRRVVDGVEEELCWRFDVPGRPEPIYERSRGTAAPFDPDRRRRLRRGEAFQRLDRSGHARIYGGTVWRPTACDVSAPSEPAAASPMCMEAIGPAREGDALDQLALAEASLASAIGAVAAQPRAQKTISTREVDEALDLVTVARARLGDAGKLPEPAAGSR